MPNGEPLAILTTMPAMIQENSGTPDAKAIPKHNCTATKNITMLDGISFLISLSIFLTLLAFDDQQFKRQSIAVFKDSNTIFTDCKAPAYNFLTIALLIQVWQRYARRKGGTVVRD